MSCCQGSCSCGKGDQFSVEQSIYLVQIASSQSVHSSFDWTKSPEKLVLEEEVVEVRFKSNRKVFYKNRMGLDLAKDDRIVVETEGGYDLGTVSLSGKLAGKRFEQQSGSNDKSQLANISRRATLEDLEHWLSAKKRERSSLLEARRISQNLGLEMSISDIEFQGDGQKANIYFSSKKSLDSQELVYLLSSAFKVKVEMNQTGII